MWSPWKSCCCLVGRLNPCWKMVTHDTDNILESKVTIGENDSEQRRPRSHAFPFYCLYSSSLTPSLSPLSPSFLSFFLPLPPLSLSCQSGIDGHLGPLLTQMHSIVSKGPLPNLCCNQILVLFRQRSIIKWTNVKHHIQHQGRITYNKYLPYKLKFPGKRRLFQGLKILQGWQTT